MSRTDRSRLVVVCGLRSEARIAAADGVTVLVGGGDNIRLAADLERAAASADGLLSFGVAGGLQPGVKPGDTRVAAGLIAPDGSRFQPDQAWTRALSSKIGVPAAVFAAVDAPLADVASKAAVYRATGAATVDMESHIVARAAVHYGITFAAIRVVTDPAERSLPHAATVGMRSDGKVDLAAILRSLGRHPGQVPSLIRTGLDARVAFAALLRCRQLLGPGFAFFDL